MPSYDALAELMVALRCRVDSEALLFCLGGRTFTGGTDLKQHVCREVALSGAVLLSQTIRSKLDILILDFKVRQVQEVVVLEVLLVVLAVERQDLIRNYSDLDVMPRMLTYILELLCLKMGK